MSKDLSAKYYQNNKKKTAKKKLAKDIKVFLKKEKEKKPHYGREQSKKLPEDEKLELVE